MAGPHRHPEGGYQKPKDVGKTIARLVGYLTKSRWMLLAVAACLLASVGSNLIGSYLMRGIINQFIYHGSTDVAGLGRAVMTLVVIFLAGALAGYGQAAFLVRMAQRGINRLRRELFDRLQQLPLSYFDKHPHGDLMSRFVNDTDNVLTALEQSVLSVASSILMAVGLVLVMLVINWKLFCVTALVLVLMMVLFKGLSQRSRTLYKTQQAALGAVNGEIQEIIEGLKVVKAFTHEAATKEKFDGLNQAYRNAAQKANFFSVMIMPISGNLMNMSYALTAAVGGLLSMTQGFDLGGLVVYLNCSRQVGQPLNQISQQMAVVLSALAGAERIFELMDTQPEIDQGQITLVRASKRGDTLNLQPPAEGEADIWAWKVPKQHKMELVQVQSPAGGQGWAWQYPDSDGTVGVHPIRGAVRNQPDEDDYYTELTGAVRFRNVEFSYVPEKKVLHDVSVYANPGQKIAFVGSTGAGKTTITNLINRFYEIQGGQITYDGIDVTDIAKDDLRRSLGAVLQDTNLFTGTIMDNIRYGRLEASDEDCIAAAKSANAHSFIRRLPNGYHTQLSGSGMSLSQGQRQLLAIARAAVADPPVMILDEATSSIDTRTEQLIQQGMDTLMEGRTVFVIAHRLSTVRNANCIVVIEHGEIVEKGNHEELMALQGRYHSLYTGQFQLA